MKAITNTQFGSSSSANILSAIAYAKGTMMCCWALNTTTTSEGDRWAMMHTNRHRCFRARDPIGIYSPSNRSLVSHVRPSTSYTTFNASQSYKSRVFRCSTCCLEYLSTYGRKASNMKSKLEPFTNRCNMKQIRNSHIKRIPYYRNYNAPLNHVSKTWALCGHRELQF